MTMAVDMKKSVKGNYYYFIPLGIIGSWLSTGLSQGGNFHFV
jgi:hypothetical protein